MIREYENGATLAELSGMYNLSKTAIQKKLVRAGVKMRSTGPAVDPEILEYIKRWYKHKPNIQIADELGIAESTVGRHAKLMGLGPKPYAGRKNPKKIKHRELPPHLIEPFWLLVCDVIESSPKLQKLLRRQFERKMVHG